MRRRSPGRSGAGFWVEAAAALAYLAFFLTFRGPKRRFWQRMTRTGAVLGVTALFADPSLRRERPRAAHLVAGTVVAAFLYGIFSLGDRAARRVMPRGSQEIGDIYSLRRLRPRAELALRLGLVVAPAEELFWRGLLQRRLAARLGRWRGAAAATALYGGAHLCTLNATLIGAATMAGAAWSTLAALEVPMPALVVSHMIWDIWIFLIQPTEKPR